MQWYNEPQEWEAQGHQLKLFVTPQTDYWRKTHYGFIVDDGPFYFKSIGGEFEVSVKITGQYKTRFDQMGLMIRINEETWVKTGVEYVDGLQNISAVVTNGYSDWSMISLDSNPNSVWLKVIRRLDALEMHYSLDGSSYKMFRMAYFPDNKPVSVGMMAASPDGNGFEALFEDFHVTHLPDARRSKWLDQNK